MVNRQVLNIVANFAGVGARLIFSLGFSIIYFRSARQRKLRLDRLLCLARRGLILVRSRPQSNHRA